MIATIRKLGNSRGVIIPKSMLEQAGLEDDAEMAFERGAIVLRRPKRNPRQGWARASRRIAQAGDDALIWPEFRNREDGALKW